MSWHCLWHGHRWGPWGIGYCNDLIRIRRCTRCSATETSYQPGYAKDGRY